MYLVINNPFRIHVVQTWNKLQKNILHVSIEFRNTQNLHCNDPFFINYMINNSLSSLKKYPVYYFVGFFSS